MKKLIISLLAVMASLCVNAQMVYVYKNNVVLGQFEDADSVVFKKKTAVSADCVDLGLSVKWATCNLGATSPEGYGNHYAWGETSTKTNYSWSTLKYCNGTSFSLTKYCTSSYYGTVDNKKVLEASDDAAAANLGSKWRMPTDAEWTELRENCYWEWTTAYNGKTVNGYIVYKAKDSSDKGKQKNTGSSSKEPTASYSLADAHIFLPAAGFRDNESLGYQGSYGYYWSSSLNDGDSYNAWCVYFFSGYVDRYYSGRYGGPSVRPVCAE